MITAVDTNILLDVLGADAKFAEASAASLRRGLREGTLIASEVVWAETATMFDNERQFREIMARVGVIFSPIPEPAAVRAARAWRAYRANGGTRTRIVADFLIGAHALMNADRLLTRDRGFYRRYFNDLEVFGPSAAPR